MTTRGMLSDEPPGTTIAGAGSAVESREGEHATSADLRASSLAYVSPMTGGGAEVVGRGWIRRWLDEWRPSTVTLGAPVFPLIVLFGCRTTTSRQPG